MRYKAPYSKYGIQHFADADVGDDVYYSVDITNALIDPLATIDSVTWAGDGLTLTDDYRVDNIAYCKILSPTAGTFTITITVNSTYNGKSETDVTKIKLAVYS